MPDNPLLDAMKSFRPDEGTTSPEALLEFILAHFDLVPKDQGDDDDGEDIVTTQESHAP